MFRILVSKFETNKPVCRQPTGVLVWKNHRITQIFVSV